MNKRARVIAFYLPQFHPTPDNDKWWGKGFTEWTNVGKAKALFKGHYQPRVPADLGYYDLRLPEIREAQAKLAKEAGIEGFCYYHYWFGDGKQELELPFNEVLRLGKPDFPFCLCWANESWHSKLWNKDGSHSQKLLIEQRYLGMKDNEEHFLHLLPAFKDHRYMKVDGKLLFMIYRPLNFPDVSEFIRKWNELAVEHKLEGFHFVGQTIYSGDVDKIKMLGFDAVNIVRLTEPVISVSLIQRCINKITALITGVPRLHHYKSVYKRFISKEERAEDVYPTIIPNWDHTPRSGKVGYLLAGSTPLLFKKHVRDVVNAIDGKSKERRVAFLKSWNEWGEGNYIEPDLKYGKGYIKALHEVVSDQKKDM